MAKRIEPVYYWDTCVFIALLSKENRPNNEMVGVRSIADANRKKENTIITSSITRTEIFKNVDIVEDYEKVLQRTNIIEISADPKITKLSSEIRKDIQGRYILEKKQINTADALHIATAIIYNVRAFHTFDNNDKPSGKKNIQWIGLLPLNGTKEVRGLRIEKPPFVNYELNFNKRIDDENKPKIRKIIFDKKEEEEK